MHLPLKHQKADDKNLRLQNFKKNVLSKLERVEGNM